jgi:GNAT superfamily N-acetyltransferase
VTIRQATLDDVPRLVELGREFITSSRYRSALRPNPDAMGMLAAKLIEAPHGLVLVSEAGGAVTGMIGVIATFHPMSGDSVMSEMFWYVTPVARGHGVRLLKAAEAWAKSHDIKQAIMISPTKKVSAFYRRVGYSKLEEQYVKAL